VTDGRAPAPDAVVGPPAADIAAPGPRAAAAPGRPGARAGGWVRAVGRFARRKPLGFVGGVIVVALLLMAAGAEWIAPHGYDDTIRGARLRPPGAEHWLGTDNLSRDLWSRIVYGARVSMTVGFLTFGGVWDLVVQRVVDAWLSFPYLIIVLSVMAVLGPGLTNVVLSLAILIAATNSRVIRGATLTVMQSPYIEAARAAGCGHARIILRHVLPNVTATIIILATIGLGAVILAESALSFLGFGVPPPYPSWGSMLSGSGRTYMFRAPWMAVWPGVAISLAVFGFNMLGDALRDVLDPRLRGS
jgi:peptide/nickel transport system permease protein